MKNLKKAFIFTLCVLLLDIVMVAAAGQTSYVTFNIGVGKSETTDYVDKTSYAPHKYSNTFTNTTLTSPCTDCIIAVRFQSSTGEFCDEAVVMNQTVTCANSSLWQPGSYRLKVWRSDATLLSTYTSGRWDY